MNVFEPRRARHLQLHLDAGEELPATLHKALDEAEVQAGWVVGAGRLEAVELVVDGRGGGGPYIRRRFDWPSELVNLTGTAWRASGILQLALWVTVALETETGLATVGGKLVSARAEAVDLLVLAFEDVPPRAALESAARRGTADDAALRSKPSDPKEAGPPALGDAPPLPPRPAKPPDDLAIYPETGDAVMHFHFGECMVIGSDGDRIRLRQTKDGRVREVALTMLRVEEFTTLPDGTRHFILTRKN